MASENLFLATENKSDKDAILLAKHSKVCYAIIKEEHSDAFSCTVS